MTTRGRGHIRIENVWKQFHRRERVDTLREALPALLRRAWRGGSSRGSDGDPFWAVRELSLEVGPGEALGIIGPNGAGKSTVLKLLSGLLEPTRGRIDVNGRVGALIELASGFHPDLTGTENVYLQGAILGMPRREIARRFDEIVAFAGVEDFLDTPVKRYSSGMNARLGFAIAAHLDPDVLLIDEVLTVGDFAFQQRATERLRELVRRDIPVVIVSHQLDRVVDLCDRALLLAGGRVRALGTAAECVETYTRGASSADDDEAWTSPLDLVRLSEPVPDSVTSGESVRVRIDGVVVRPADARLACAGLRVRKLPDGATIFATNTLDARVALPQQGKFAITVQLEMNVGPGVYALEAAVWHVEERRRWASGPARTVHVERASDVYGPVNLRPEMSVTVG